MRIDCPKCGAAFAIDERRIPPKGVRAQCPLCGDRVIVRLPGTGPVPGNRAAAPAVDPGAGPIARPSPADRPRPAAPAAPGSSPAAAEPRLAAPPFGPPPAAPGRGPAPPPAEPPRSPTPYLATVDDSYTPGPLGLLETPFGGPPGYPVPPPPATPSRPDLPGLAASPFAGFDDFPELTPPHVGLSPAAPPSVVPPRPPQGALGTPLPDLPPPPWPGLPAAPPPASGGPASPGAPAAAFPGGGAPSAEPAPPGAGPSSTAFALFGGEPGPEATASDILAEIAPPPERSDPRPAAAAPDDDPFADLDPVRELTDPGLAAVPPPPDPSAPVQLAARPLGVLAPRAAAQGDGAVWKIRRAGGGEEAPVNFARLKAMVEARELADDDMVARGETTFWPASDHPAVQAILRRSRPVIASARLPEPARKVPRWAFAAAAVALLALALVAWRAWPRDEPPALRLTREAFARRLDAWKAAVPAPPGTAPAHEKKGRSLLREDTPEALRSAMEEFRLAAVLDPTAMVAVAGYVEARALLGFGPRDREAAVEASELIDHAAQVAGHEPAVLRANAHLLLSLEATGNLLQARTLAEKALERSGGDLDDLVALGRSLLGSNPDAALRTLDRALEKDPQHRRALLYRAQAKERLGREAAAVQDYEARYALSPGDPEALRALLRITAGVGAYDRTRNLLEGVLARRPGDPEARLGLGVLAYQVDGDRRRAADVFAGLVADKTLPIEILGRAAGHAAALAREAGDTAAAADFVASAPGSDAAVAPARYQDALLALGRGRPDEARLALAAIPPGALDSSTRALLEGRIHLVADAPREALASFQTAQRAAPRRLEPYLFLASAYARVGDSSGAFGALRGAMDLDPAARPGALTDFYESRATRLAGLDRPLLDLAGDRVELALAHTAAGVIRYHRGDSAGAVPLFTRTLELDSLVMPAQAYLAQVALDRGEAAKALELARGAAGLEKLLAIGPFLEGRAREALGEVPEAVAAYERAVAGNPSFSPAAARLGALALRAGKREEAEKRLLQAIQSDPENAEARGALFQLGR